MSNVKIALRVRPLSNLESLDENSSKAVVKVEDDQTVAITNLKVPASNAGDSRERVKRFNFDYCFDSSNPSGENFSTQEKIFEKLGEIVLSSIARGQDACVLAYGQSASGKTHTMQGTENQPGLVPRLCDAIMEASGDGIAEAVVSYFEIYNERVRDLLSPRDVDTLQQGKESSGPSANQLRGLRVREHPRKGPYVEDLSELTVRSRDQLSSVLTLAAGRRRSAATRSNPQSSRSHALLALRGAATLTLLDLAGSERPSRVNQSLSRQKEGASINRSLVALANVISALATPSPRGNRYVPYRDSVLTWLLKDTLSGFTTTIMIATVSPSSSCYAETVNTMRWAARAGRIPPGAGAATRGPRAASERSLRALRAEVARLRRLLEAAKAKVAAPFAHQAIQVSFDARADDVRKQTKQEETHDVSEISDCTIKEETTLGNLGQERDGADSLASSRMSVASNDTLSGNNSIPSTRSNARSIQTEDLLFGPRLHRTGSVHEVPLPPLRNKKRQYSSHEVLPSSEKYRITKSTDGKAPSVRLNKTVINRLAEKEKSNLENRTAERGEDTKDQSKTSLDNLKAGFGKSHVTYQPFNKRAVIVASVTDRLYSTSKKKEEAMPVNSAQSAINKNPTNEIKIYSNAKRRLLDISYKAIRASRRLRVGVAAETQTENNTSVRVKEVAIDIQNDIEPFSLNYAESDKVYRHASVETESVTVRCKEASAGPAGGSIHSDDKSVGTDKLNRNTKFVFTKTCGNMTEEARSLNVASTQTREFAPPRKKYSSFTKYLKINRDSPAPSNGAPSSPSVLNISISHDCNRFENETGAISDDSLENESLKPSDARLPPVHATPDLLNNHNPIDSANSAAGPSQIAYAIPPGKAATLAKCAINRDVVTSEFRENSKVTNYESVIKSKTQGNINQTCDRVTSAPREVIKQAGVTWRISQSAASPPIFASDTERANKSVGTDEPTRESYIYESKATQVNSAGTFSCADFLEDIYVPLPRICVTSDLRSDGWPNMRSLIMGRNENIYPYNIKLSPKKCCELNHRKKTKSVSWKSDSDLVTSSNARCRLPETGFHHRGGNGEVSKCGHKSACLSDSKLGSDSLYQRQINHSNISEKPQNNYFKGIQCWDDRIQTPTTKTVSDKTKHLQKAEHFQVRDQDTKCLQYMKATSNLIKEATNLVASLSKVKSELSEPLLDNSAPPITSISRVCNEQLQIIDENTNKNTIPERQYSVPSTSSGTPPIPPSTNKIDSSRTINAELIDNEEQLHNSLEYSDNHPDLFDETIFSSDDELLSTGKEIDAIEKDLFTSLDRLEDCTGRTKEYFSTASERYSEKFNRQLSSLPPNWQNGPTPYPRTKRNPSKYLEELRNLRRELVESTKRDDSICRQFQMN